MGESELAAVLNRRRQEVDTRGNLYVKDRAGHADAVWYERIEGQFSPRSSDRNSAISRLTSISRMNSREPSPSAPVVRPTLTRRASEAPPLENDRVRRSFPRRASTGAALKAPVRPMNSRNCSPVRSPSEATPQATPRSPQRTPQTTPQTTPRSSTPRGSAKAKAKAGSGPSEVRASRPSQEEPAASIRSDSVATASTISCEAASSSKPTCAGGPMPAPENPPEKPPGVPDATHQLEQLANMPEKGSGTSSSPSSPSSPSRESSKQATGVPVVVPPAEQSQQSGSGNTPSKGAGPHETVPEHLMKRRLSGSGPLPQLSSTPGITPSCAIGQPQEQAVPEKRSGAGILPRSNSGVPHVAPEQPAPAEKLSGPNTPPRTGRQGVQHVLPQEQPAPAPASWEHCSGPSTPPLTSRQGIQHGPPEQPAPSEENGSGVPPSEQPAPEKRSGSSTLPPTGRQGVPSAQPAPAPENGSGPSTPPQTSRQGASTLPPTGRQGVPSAQPAPAPENGSGPSTPPQTSRQGASTLPPTGRQGVSHGVRPAEQPVPAPQKQSGPSTPQTSRQGVQDVVPPEQPAPAPEIGSGVPCVVPLAEQPAPAPEIASGAGAPTLPIKRGPRVMLPEEQPPPPEIPSGLLHAIPPAEQPTAAPEMRSGVTMTPDCSQPKPPQQESPSPGLEEDNDSPVRPMTTGVSSWRQLSLGSLATSSGGLPTILTEKSPRKVPEDHTVRECAEPEPAPSPDQRSLDQRSLPTQPMDLCFARAGPVQPALVLSIPGMPGRVGTSGSAYSCDSEELRPDSREYRELWEAVLEGNLAQLEDLLARGLLNGRLCDVNGHSIFWNALAHQQVQVAMFLLHRFPPGGPRGIDLSEVHAKRGDTLLHLCVYLHHFSAPAAELFQSLFGSRPGWDAESLQAYRCRGNAELETVAHCAAARLNFWVLRFLAAWELPLLFLRNRYGLTAVEVLLQKLQDANVSCPLLATLPLSEAEMARPAWTDFTAYLPGRSQSFADLELEVQDETSGSCRVRAHRAILAAASGVLHQQLLDLPAGRPLLIDPLCCRSRKVLEMALTFLYCSQLSCDFAEDGFRLWQLLCLCATFHLPEPLWRFAKSAMLRTLGNPEFAAVAAVALEAREEIHLSGPEVCFVAHALLRSPEAALRKWPTEQQRQVLLVALAELELQAIATLET